MDGRRPHIPVHGEAEIGLQQVSDLLDNPDVVCTLPSNSISSDLQKGALLQLNLPIKLSQPPVGVLYRRSLTMDTYAESLILSLRETANEP